MPKLKLNFDYVDGVKKEDTDIPLALSQRAEERGEGRENYLAKMSQNLTTPMKQPITDIPIRAAAIPLQAMMGGYQRGEAAIANPAMAAQQHRQNIDEALPEDTTLDNVSPIERMIATTKGSLKTGKEMIKGVAQGITGEKLGEFGDVFTGAGATEGQSKALGLGTAISFTNYLTAGKLLKALPKIHTDKIMTSAGGGMANSVDDIMGGIRQSYKEAWKPFLQKNVIFSDVKAALNSIKDAKLARKLLTRFSTRTLDKAGNPVVTIEHLNNMRYWVDDLIKMPKEQLKGLGASMQELLKLKASIKNTALKYIPKQAQVAIGMLDDKFKPVMDKGGAILKLIRDKGGRIKTEWLARVFKNPDSSGSREFIKGLKEIGVNPDEVLRLFGEYAKRQATKQFIGKAGETALRWGLIAGAMRKGVTRGDNTMTGGQ